MIIALFSLFYYLSLVSGHLGESAEAPERHAASQLNPVTTSGAREQPRILETWRLKLGKPFSGNTKFSLQHNGNTKRNNSELIINYVYDKLCLWWFEIEVCIFLFDGSFF